MGILETGAALALTTGEHPKSTTGTGRRFCARGDTREREPDAEVGANGAAATGAGAAATGATGTATGVGAGAGAAVVVVVTLLIHCAGGRGGGGGTAAAAAAAAAAARIVGGGGGGGGKAAAGCDGCDGSASRSGDVRVFLALAKGRGGRPGVLFAGVSSSRSSGGSSASIIDASIMDTSPFIADIGS